ncbi:CLUMA_CG001461, isoform A [Clunio marinus]|uniref:CLUMA_CG001461, isoform A n=1 Tax=Clunio marinus TaxID=568069 RepID=A0A1J1HJT0_9DIPT|nr:CLUMA_CG001461, isoform A [Clunio marinus]
MLVETKIIVQQVSQQSLNFNKEFPSVAFESFLKNDFRLRKKPVEIPYNVDMTRKTKLESFHRIKHHCNYINVKP